MNRSVTLDEDELREALSDLTLAQILAAADPQQPAHTIREGIVAALLRFVDASRAADRAGEVR